MPGQRTGREEQGRADSAARAPSNAKRSQPPALGIRPASTVPGGPDGRTTISDSRPPLGSSWPGVAARLVAAALRAAERKESTSATRSHTENGRRGEEERTKTMDKDTSRTRGQGADRTKEIQPTNWVDREAQSRRRPDGTTERMGQTFELYSINAQYWR